jgi:hypothetical protein
MSYSKLHNFRYAAKVKDRQIISPVLKKLTPPPLSTLCGYFIAPVGTTKASLRLQGMISWSLNIGCIPAALEILATRKSSDIRYLSSSRITGLEWPRGFQEVKVPRLHDNGTGWW